MGRSGDLSKDKGGPKDKSGQGQAGTLSLPALFAALGVTLVVMSFLPFDDLVMRRMWNAADTARYNRITLEYHRSAYQTPARAGLTQPQWQSRHEHLQNEFEALRDKLARAQQSPHTWSKMLLWSGALLALGGGLRYRAARSKE